MGIGVEQSDIFCRVYDANASARQQVLAKYKSEIEREIAISEENAWFEPLARDLKLPDGSKRQFQIYQ